MLILTLIFGAVCLLLASYVSALGVVYLLNKFLFQITFDALSYIECPLSLKCVEYGIEYKNWIWTITIIIFVISGLIAPALYYHKEHR